jgi:hypothetical protein
MISLRIFVGLSAITLAIGTALGQTGTTPNLPVNNSDPNLPYPHDAPSGFGDLTGVWLMPSQDGAITGMTISATTTVTGHPMRESIHSFRVQVYHQTPQEENTCMGNWFPSTVQSIRWQDSHLTIFSPSAGTEVNFQFSPGSESWQGYARIGTFSSAITLRRPQPPVKMKTAIAGTWEKHNSCVHISTGPGNRLFAWEDTASLAQIDYGSPLPLSRFGSAGISIDKDPCAAAASSTAFYSQVGRLSPNCREIVFPDDIRWYKMSPESCQSHLLYIAAPQM